ncbi:MAG: N-acetylmuramoyl-L-alanine amidase [Mycobacteriales bacterium]
MSRPPLAVVVLVLLVAACTDSGKRTALPAVTSATTAGAVPTIAASSGPSAAGSSALGGTAPSPTVPPPTVPSPTAPALSAPAASASASAPQPRPTASTPAPGRSDGPGPPWPSVRRGPAPPAYGAVVTTRVAALPTGGVLASGLLLPRLDGSGGSPLVMTPCGNRVRLRRADVRLVPPGGGGSLPKPASSVVVLIDPGHGGPADGAVGVDGSREADRVLDLAMQVARYADAKVGRVYLTRSRDFDATLEFRTLLGDALRVDAAISVHLNAQGFTPLDRPGVETYGALSDPQGRRLAGVMYERQRQFLEQFPGPWVGYRDAGAKYRISRRGGDYYGLLRRSHRPWVISESLFMTSAHDIALLDRPDFVAQLARAIADASVAFTTTSAPGSGWVQPRPSFPEPSPGQAPRPKPCVDPAR